MDIRKSQKLQTSQSKQLDNSQKKEEMGDFGGKGITQKKIIIGKPFLHLAKTESIEEKNSSHLEERETKELTEEQQKNIAKWIDVMSPRKKSQKTDKKGISSEKKMSVDEFKNENVKKNGNISNQIIELEKNIESKKSNTEKLKKSNESLENKKNETEKTLKEFEERQYPDDEINTNEINDKGKIISLKKEISNLEEAISQNNEEIQKNQEIIKSSSGEIKNLKNEKNDLKKELLSNLQKEIGNLNKLIEKDSQNSGLKTQRTNLQLVMVLAAQGGLDKVADLELGEGQKPILQQLSEQKKMGVLMEALSGINDSGNIGNIKQDNQKIKGEFLNLNLINEQLAGLKNTDKAKVLDSINFAVKDLKNPRQFSLLADLKTNKDGKIESTPSKFYKNALKREEEFKSKLKEVQNNKNLTPSKKQEAANHLYVMYMDDIGKLIQGNKYEMNEFKAKKNQKISDELQKIFKDFPKNSENDLTIRNLFVKYLSMIGTSDQKKERIIEDLATQLKKTTKETEELLKPYFEKLYQNTNLEKIENEMKSFDLQIAIRQNEENKIHSNQRSSYENSIGTETISLTNASKVAFQKMDRIKVGSSPDSKKFQLFSAIRDFFSRIANRISVTSEGRKLLTEAKTLWGSNEPKLVFTEKDDPEKEKLLLAQLDRLLTKASALRTADGKEALLNEKDLKELNKCKKEIENLQPKDQTGLSDVGKKPEKQLDLKTTKKDENLSFEDFNKTNPGDDDDVF